MMYLVEPVMNLRPVLEMKLVFTRIQLLDQNIGCSSNTGK